jgi:hypothetical protein
LLGRIAGLLFVALSVASACGGHSVATATDDGAPDDGFGDDGETGGFSGVGGSVAVGGAAPSGGTSAGDAGYAGAATGGFGGAVAMGGASGSVSVGGSSPCAECPDWEYGLAIEGDGPPFAMDYNGHVVAQPDTDAPPVCPETPLRGGIGGCGYFMLAACEGPHDGPRCLEISGGTARYLDEAGRIWSGPVTTLASNPSIPGVASGVFTLQLSADGNAILVLTVDYSFCTGLILLDICR